MINRAKKLIKELNLKPHTEGGYFSEIYRSQNFVKPLDSRSNRSALTTIYFLLLKGQKSRLHKVLSDEVWHFYEGAPLELFTIDKKLQKSDKILLGPVRKKTTQVFVVPAGFWQAAQTTGEYTLVGCTVAPGFEFADFSMVNKNSKEEKYIVSRFPKLAKFL